MANAGRFLSAEASVGSTEDFSSLGDYFKREFHGIAPMYSFREATEDIFRAYNRAELKEFNHNGFKFDEFIDKMELFGNTKAAEWQDSSLQPQDISIIRAYCEDSPFFHVINTRLRNRNRDMLRPFKKAVWLLMHALQKCPPYEGDVVFRGIKGFDAYNAYLGHPEGSPELTRVWHEFISTSTKISVVRDFLYNDPQSPHRYIYVIKLHTNRGRNIKRFSPFSDEDEILFPPNSKFRVTHSFMDVRPGEDLLPMDSSRGLWIVEVEELPPDDPILDFDANARKTKAELYLEIIAQKQCATVLQMQLEEDKAVLLDKDSKQALAIAALEQQIEANGQCFAAESIRHSQRQSVLEKQIIGMTQAHTQLILERNAQLDVKTTRITELETQIKELSHLQVDASLERERNLKLCSQLSEYEIRINELSNKVVELELEIERNQKQLSQIPHFELQIAEYAHKFAKFNAQNNTGAALSVHIIELQKQIDDLTEKAVNYELEKEYSQKLLSQVAELEGQMVDYCRKQTEAQLERGKNSELAVQIQALEGQVSELSHKILDVQLEKEALAHQIQLIMTRLPREKEANETAVASYDTAAKGLFDCYMKVRCGSSEALQQLKEAAEVRPMQAANYLASCLMAICLYNGHGNLRKDRVTADGLIQTSFAWLLSQSGGCKYAQSCLGRLYRDGYSVAKDPIEAVRLLRLAANQGEQFAQVWLGTCYQAGNGVDKDESEALRLIDLAAKQSNAAAQEMMGTIYQNGKGVEKDITLAVRWYKQAAEKNFDRGLYSLALCYANGKGVDKNYIEAAKLFRLAADQGYIDAQLCLATCYSNGRGVEKDYIEAVRWCRLAADQGSIGAQLKLANYYTIGKGVAADEAEAARWYLLAAEQGNPTAQFFLGDCYDHGRGVKKNPTEAANWYQLSAEQGHTIAQFNLGVCYETGQGVAKDINMAIYWFKSAAEKNDKDAQFKLGSCFTEGLGVTKDDVQAQKWFQRAADQGHMDALKLLSKT